MKLRSTTILAVRHRGEVALGGDGQVTLGETIVKHKAAKVRRLYGGKVLIGFAGAAADALSLFEMLESKLERFSGDLYRAAVELARDWRTDKVLRRLDASMIAVDSRHMFLISGTGDLIAPDDNLLAIGSGAPMAMAAARALIEYSDLTASQIVRKALEITSQICIYTNGNITVESLPAE
ncbi:HslU--HslV peptidase proteolytic subunit [Candidatus Poribacteria bacterium]|nr:MAG: HslU--HslV peptidase proteolytic subunit [Candidatus Poribacteria bacterium]